MKPHWLALLRRCEQAPDAEFVVVDGDSRCFGDFSKLLPNAGDGWEDCDGEPAPRMASFHNYCHAVMHWNLPSNPIDLEQREGRVHRYKGHAVRRNIARRYGPQVSRMRNDDPWEGLFAIASAECGEESGGIAPYWVFPVEGGAVIERHVPALPLNPRSRLSS